MYCAYVTRIHNLRKHTNADRLLCGECFGNTVIVDLGTDPDQLGVYFPTDGKLGLDFAQKNDLLRRKDENGAPAGGYLDPEKRNIKALKLRGEKSDGLFLPLSCLASFTDIKKLQEGDTISVLNGITICEKYIPAVKRASGSGGGGNHVRKRSDPISPLFQEHADTEQLAYNLSAFHFMRYRCEQMGVKYVPLMYRGLIPEEEIFTGTSCELTNAGEWIKTKAEQYYDGPDPVGHTHVREGVVCRIVNRPKFAAYKHKNFAFKALEGLIKDTAAAPDMEEAQVERQTSQHYPHYGE